MTKDEAEAQRDLYQVSTVAHPRLVYAWEGETDRLHAEIERLKALVRSMGGDPR